MRKQAEIAFGCVILFCLWLSAGHAADSSGTDTPALELARVFPQIGLQQPLAMLPAPQGVPGTLADSVYIVEQPGRVLRVGPDQDAAVFADIRMDVDNSSYEGGLLGMAFDPAFADNGHVYLSYTREGDDGLVSVIARYQSHDRGLSLDDDSRQVLLEVQQPYSNHNGGQIAFGPDGHLYIGFGDGGSAGDPHGHAQNTRTLLGALLRIDVKHAGKKQAYAIPSDNPFSQGGGRPEIYAWGLRNPWRWSFDRKTGQLWLADVGQDDWEEINIIEKGGNYGWNILEGRHCYRAKNCRRAGMIEPVAQYPNADDCSITGGYVYRGKEMPGLRGVYLYGDYCSGRIRALLADEKGGYRQRILIESRLRISSFAEDRQGELYAIDHGGGIYKITGKNR